MFKYETNPNATCTRQSCAYLVKNHVLPFVLFLLQYHIKFGRIILKGLTENPNSKILLV